MKRAILEDTMEKTDNGTFKMAFFCVKKVLEKNIPEINRWEEYHERKAGNRRLV